MQLKTTVSCALVAILWTSSLWAEEAPSFLAFESGPVRPLALSPGGDRLVAVNTPDNRLEVFAVSAQGLAHQASVAVGMEPVAVAWRSGSEVWVVNHLSDSVSILDMGPSGPRVVRTLLVGDEPRDLVFAGEPGNRAFITTAHRGQHRTHASLAGVPGAGDPELSTPGVGRADVWVFDADNLGTALGGKPLAIVTLFGDTPRALAASPDRRTVYAAVFHSGNQTTVVTAAAVCNGFQATDLEDACPEEFPGVPGGNPGPATNHQGAPAPEVGLVVRYHRPSGEWRDELGRSWNGAVRFNLPDQDVFAIDAQSLVETAAFPHVGTILFNMTVHPTNGNLYVSNQEARNEVRFEGPGDFGGSTVQGHLAEARITVIRDGEVEPRHLNKHIDYDLRPAPGGIKEHSLATPLEMAVSADGETLYVAAFGSSKVGVFSTTELEQDSFQPQTASAGYIEVSGGGPAGLVLDDAAQRLYVFTRFDNGVSVVDLEGGPQEIQHLTFFNPEPPAVTSGRPLLYDAVATSSNGEASCSSCHTFADMDGLAWDLGDPDGEVTQSPIEIVFGEGVSEALRPNINGTGEAEDFHPMKGPMTTQTLRGLVNSGAQHWRGDRATGVFGSDPSDSNLSLRNFNPAFPGLLGRTAELETADIEKLADFVLSLILPPNPVAQLDNSLTPEQRLGRNFYIGPRRSDGLAPPSPFGFTCEECHVLAPENGHYGTDGRQSFEGESQIFKIPHLRNAYQKVGMFGSPRVGGNTLPDAGHIGDQVRGTGYLHDGSIDHLLRFFHGGAFEESNDGRVGFRNNRERRGMVEFVLAFPTDLAPIVGQQITLRSDSFQGPQPGFAAARIDLLLDRAGAPFVSKVLGGEVTECDVIVKGRVAGEERGWHYDPALSLFFPDRESEPPLKDTALRDLARTPGQELTYTCAPPGSGVRMGVDRDGDGFYDRDELDAGADPADATSFPTACVPSRYQLCLGDNRFAVSVRWHDAPTSLNAAQVVSEVLPDPATDSGILWFFDAENWEMLVKVLDGCGYNQHFWVLAAATTNVGYTLKVRDIWANQTLTYSNDLGTVASPLADITAFDTCGASPAPQAGQTQAPVAASSGDLPFTPSGAATTGGSCPDDASALCLQQGRFRIEVDWQDFAGATGSAQAVPLFTDASGILWFFDPDNWEMLVKVLDGCSFNARYWVFSAAATNVAYTLKVTDTATGETKSYHNPAGTLSPALADTDAFASCP